MFYGSYLLVALPAIFMLADKLFGNDIIRFYNTHMPISVQAAAVSYNQPEIPRSLTMWEMGERSLDVILQQLYEESNRKTQAVQINPLKDLPNFDVQNNLG